MTALAILAAISIAFPREGQKLPAVTNCYLLGSTTGGETNIVVQGRDVPVHRLGGWVTMIDVHEGTNVVSVGGASVSFTVAKKPVASAAGKSAPPKPYKKLEYAGDNPKDHPKGRRPDAITVVVDAGHGGGDSGAWSPHGRQEKDVNLMVAQALREELAKRGYSVVMTRTDDSFPALYDRPKVAHSHGADAFISIHHNAPPLDKDPRRLRYHAVYAWNGIGEKLATAINRRMADAFGKTLVNNGVIHANFAVTRNPEIPSCLVEVDFISTPEGEADCWDGARQRKVAAAIAAGFDDWAEPARDSETGK